jgi:regulator of protease activity HflC (stomatin/prohibitin superfamily)
MNSRHLSLGVIFVSVLVLLLVWNNNAHNVQAPAGYATYVVERPIFGATTFKEVILGPDSTGLGWRLYGDRVSVTPYSYSESFVGSDAVIAKDKLAMQGSAHIVFRIRSDKESIRTYMEKFGGLEEQLSADDTAHLAYQNYIQQPFKTLIREEFATENGLEVPNKIGEMGADITRKLSERLANTPFEVMQVVIGNAQPPQLVLDQIAQKVAKTQELERKATEQQIAELNKNIQKAEGEADGEKELAIATQRALANKQISDSITPQLLQYLAIENMKNAAKIYVPIGTNGMPIVGTVSTEAPARPSEPAK